MKADPLPLPVSPFFLIFATTPLFPCVRVFDAGAAAPPGGEGAGRVQLLRLVRFRRSTLALPGGPDDTPADLQLLSVAAFSLLDDSSPDEHLAHCGSWFHVDLCLSVQSCDLVALTDAMLALKELDQVQLHGEGLGFSLGF